MEPQCKFHPPRESKYKRQTSKLKKENSCSGNRRASLGHIPACAGGRKRVFAQSKQISGNDLHLCINDFGLARRRERRVGGGWSGGMVGVGKG